MNRIYRLVWNRSLAAVQVTSELAHARGSQAGKAVVRAPRRRPLALAIAALALGALSAPVWSQTCTPVDPSGCGAPGGIGFRQTRSPNGGAGNGTGGDATVWIGDTSEGPGTVGSAGNGGNGANGIFNPDSSINVTANGGTGGTVGATDNVGSSVNGGTGGVGEAAAAANSQSIVGGGGGGGGAGAYLSQSNVNLAVGAGITIAGGAGGKGGDALASVANGYAANGDPGAGGGGGAGAIIGAGAGGVSFAVSGHLLGGAGGAGGNGGYAGGGGGGGDGLLVLGAATAVINNAGGSIIGGNGGHPGTFENGRGEPGGYGGGGAGVNLVGAGSSLQNLGSIVGGNSGVSPVPDTHDQDGVPGVGVRAWGGEVVVNTGSIAGGSNGVVQADSVLFSGGGNQLVIQAGASFTGNIESTSGTTNGGDVLTLAGDTDSSLNAGLIVGFATNTKTGASNWTLTGTGTAGINWTIQQGQLSGSTSTFAGNLVISSNGVDTPAVEFNQASDGIYSGTITGTGQLIKDGSGALTFGASSDLSSLVGTFTVNGGSVILQNLGNLQGLEVVGNAPFTFDVSGTIPPTAMVAGISGPAGSSINLGSHSLDLLHPASDTFSGVISGSGGLTLVTGTETLDGANTYTGDTVVGATGTLNIASGGRLGVNGASATRLELDGTLNAGGMGAGTTLTISSLNGSGTLTLGSVLLDITNALPSDNFSGGISGGTAGLTLDGGTQTLSGYNVYTGDTTINNGAKLVLAGGAQIGSGLSRLNIANGTVDASNLTPGSTLALLSLAGTGDLLMGSSGLDIKIANDTYSGVISGSGDLTLDSGAETFSGANSYSGQTTFNGGTLTLTGNGQLGGGNSRVVFNTGTATIDATNMTAGTLPIASLAGGGSVKLGANTLVINNASDTYSGAITGTGGLTLNGGIQTLSGANIAYSGATTINSGTLKLENGANVGNGQSLLTMTGGALDATSLVAGSTLSIQAVQGDGSIQLGGSNLLIDRHLSAGATDPFNGTISGSGGVTIASGNVGLNGINMYTGVTNVTGSTGFLMLGDNSHRDASIAGDVIVSAGALEGYGTVKGNVTISRALLGPGDVTQGTFTIDGNLDVGDGSQLGFKFGSPGPNFATPGQSDHVVVGGNLSIGQSLLLADDIGGMGPGLYNLFTWGDTLSITGGGFAPPAGMSLQILSVDKQINLIDTQNLTLSEWDANGLAGPGSMGGGSGTWSLFSNTWSDTTGQFVGPMSPEPGFAIFGGAAGTVTVDDSSGNVGVTGMQFVSDGYHLTGDAIDLVGQNNVAPVLRVSSGDTAVIDNVLTGTDGFNKTDGGTLVLNGANVYTGTTTLSGGYLSVSSNDNLGGAANPLDFEGGTLKITGTAFTQTVRDITWGAPGGGFDIDDAANTFTVAQALTGTGGLLKSGAGTLVLTGANTYSGGTIIDQGTLQGDSNSLQGDITDNAALVFDQANDGTYGGVISGTGIMTKTGAGVLTLSGANTYTGGTTISAGTLQGDASSLQGNIVDNAALVFDQAIDGSYGGVISGSGSVSKTGTGVLSLTGANAYSGGTTISAGTLQGDSNSLQGSITDNATLAFNQASDGAFSGVISGSGSVSKTGAGALSLTGVNTYSGGTTISAGALQGDTSSLQGNIVDNASLVFNQGVDGTFASAISGSGSLTKSGAGLLILNGVNTYTGTTTVSAGTLEVGDSNTPSASISSDVTVGSGGTLRGHGSINGNVTNDGIVWAGGSVGTLTIAGDYTQNADGTLRLDVTPTQSSQLKVSGNAMLGGTLDLVFAPGTYGTTQYTLLQAGSLSGTFATVTGTVPGAMTSQIAYTATEADLVLGQQQVVKPMDGSLFGNMMRGVALAGQRDMSTVLDAGLISSDTPCGGDRTPSRENVSAACAGGAWAQYSGSALSLDGADGMNSTAFGLLGGIDYAMGDAVHLGVQAGVGQVNGNDKGGGSGRAENVHGGVYAYANAGPVVLSALADWMHTDYHFQRASGIGPAASTPGGQMLSGALQAAWPVQSGAWQFTPKLGVLFQRQTLAGFGETLNSSNPNAASFPVDGARSRSISLQPYAAIDLKNSFVAGGVAYVPELSLGYRYNTHDPVTPGVQVIAQDGTPFILPGATQGRGFGTVNARITAQAGDSWSVYMGYQGLFGSRLRDNALNFGFNKRF